MEECIFCKIAGGKDEKTVLLFEDETLVVFKDIKPATAHHYLVVTKEHITDAKSLTVGQAELVEKMVEAGKDVIVKQGGDINDVRMGFHWPPFHLVKHLHLHTISSTKDMGWIARGIFLPNSYWFVSPDWVLEKLKTTEAKEKSTELWPL